MTYRMTIDYELDGHVTKYKISDVGDAGRPMLYLALEELEEGKLVSFSVEDLNAKPGIEAAIATSQEIPLGVLEA